MATAMSLEERYDPAVAEAMLAHGARGGGSLPPYLGLELVRFAPGKLWAQATLREELLTPFGNVHGGVIAAIVERPFRRTRPDVADYFEVNEGWRFSRKASTPSLASGVWLAMAMTSTA